MAIPRAERLSGRKFGLLTVETLDHIGSSGHAYWLCKCECGGTKVVRASHLKLGNVSSWGCIPPRRTHGGSGSRLYVIWNAMKQRCFNANSPEYHLYGGRGITVCDEWRNSFEVFRDWALANGYRENLTIDRKDNDKGYCPDNCRWATAMQQANNTRKTRLLTYKGETRSVSEWARILGIRQSTLNMRLNKYRWSVEDALSKGVKNHISQ